MPKHTPKVPSYRLHKPSGQAVVTLSGSDHYLGEHNTVESHDQYNKLVSRWLANGRRTPDAASHHPLSVNELILAYFRHCEELYGSRRTKGTRLSQIRSTMQPLKQLFGSTSAAEFGPKALLLVRQRFLEGGWERKTRRNGKSVVERAKPWSRKTVNDHIQVVKRMFRWAVREEMLTASVWHSLSAVEGLRAGESTAADPKTVRAVPGEHVDEIRKHVSAQVWAMVELQRITGMRSGEVLIMRGQDIDTSGELWLYRPESHKTQHLGHERIIELGPLAQAIVRPFLRSGVDEFLFSPCDAVADFHAARRRARKSRVQPSQRSRSKVKPLRKPGRRYTVATYRQAVDRACKLADVPHWHPHQLRHNYATRIRKEFGVEATRILLGHRSTAVTELYAEIDRGRVREIVSQVG